MTPRCHRRHPPSVSASGPRPRGRSRGQPRSRSPSRYPVSPGAGRPGGSAGGYRVTPRGPPRSQRALVRLKRPHNPEPDVAPATPRPRNRIPSWPWVMLIIPRIPLRPRIRVGPTPAASPAPASLGSSAPKFLSPQIPQPPNSSAPEFLSSRIPRPTNSSSHKFLGPQIPHPSNSSAPPLWDPIPQELGPPQTGAVFSQEPGGAGLFLPASSPNLGLITSCCLCFHLPHFLSPWLRMGPAWGTPNLVVLWGRPPSPMPWEWGNWGGPGWMWGAQTEVGSQLELEVPDGSGDPKGELRSRTQLPFGVWGAPGGAGGIGRGPGGTHSLCPCPCSSWGSPETSPGQQLLVTGTGIAQK